MRLIKLQILNLASLDRQGGEEINFEEGALKDSTIFSIVGPTGSGKSTILDAICLALYNRAPRYPKDGRKNARKIEIYGSPDDGESNRPAPTDNKNILTRGKKDAYSKLTFLANDQSIYRAEWSVHRKTKNIDDPVTALYKISTVNGQPHEEEAEWNKLPQIIGLDYDQFLRTVLIAQGSFANFLTSSENERYELLEKLIGCEELYTTIAEKIKREKDIATNAYTQLSANFSAFEKDIIKDPEELNALTERIRFLEEEDKKAKAELTKISDSLNWYTAEEKFLENIAKFEEAYSRATQELEAIKADIDRLSLHDTTLTAVGFYKEIKTSEKNILSHKNELKAIAEQHSLKERALHEEDDRLKVLALKADKAGQEIAVQKPHIDRARVIKGELAIASKTLNEKILSVKDAEAALLISEKALTNNASAIEKAQSAVILAEEGLARLKNAIETKIKELQSEAEKAGEAYAVENNKVEAVDVVALQNAKSLAEKKQRDIKEAIRIRKALALNIETLSKNAETSKSLTERNLAIDEELSRLTIEALASDLELDRKIYTLMSCENWQEHRLLLKESEPCPLCGSVHHPYADTSAVIPAVNDFKRRIDSKQQELNRQTSLKEQLNKEKSSNEGQIKTLEAAMSRLRNEQNDLIADWEEIHQAYPEWQDDAQNLTLLKPSIDSEAKTVQQSLAEYNALAKKVNTLRTAKENAERAFSKYKDDAEIKIKHGEKTVTDAVTLLQTEKGKTDNLTQQKVDKANALDIAKKALAAAKSDVEAKHVAIKKEIGDKDPDAFEQELQREKKTADEAVVQKNEVIVRIQGEIKALEGKSETVAKAMAGEQDKQEENTQKLTDWLYAYNNAPDHALSLSVDDIALLHSATDDWETVRKMQQLYTNKKTSAETTLLNEKKNHADHQQKKPEQEKETLSVRKAELEGKSNNELVEAKTRKQRHDYARQQAGALGAQKDEAEQLKDEWEQITNAIGIDGKTLRKIAQCYTLRFLIEHANVEIRKFNSRYELQQVKNSLGIRVIDHDRADDVRDVTSLSGGETFIVSLGLALGLSALSSRNISFENLFIDEGFGTLDPDTLDSVIDSLAMLQTSQGKKVGVISHTDTMSERIATQIRIIKNGHSGSSHIEIYP